MMNQRGFFLVLESIDGAGKSTVVSELKKLYPDAIYLAEPYSTDLGKHIHEFCKAHWNELDDVTKGLLYTAQRREHLLHVMLPALEQGKLVVSERSYISTLVYQDDESVVSLHYDYIDPILEEYNPIALSPTVIFPCSVILCALEYIPTLGLDCNNAFPIVIVPVLV